MWRWRDRIYRNQYSDDHLIAKEQWGSNHPDNIDRKRKTRHKGKHEYLWTLKFHDQIISILEENRKTLTPEAQKEFDTLKIKIKELVKDKLFYNPKCFRK